MISRAIKNFSRMEAAAGILLVAAACIALICANLPVVSEYYDALLHLPFELKLGPLELKKNFLLLVNDGLMAIFFLVVALEIKREIVQGELSSPAQVVLPVAAAIGGVVAPALIFFYLVGGDPIARQGWAIPLATDIAFSLGVLSLLGSRVPSSLTVFLTTIAVVDDLIAIVIIAVFYTSKLSLAALGLGVVGILVLLLLNLRGVSKFAPFILIGLLIWVCVLKSGVHATLAGVVVGFLVPFKAGDNGEESPALKLEHELHSWVAYGILPLFAFANAGVSLSGVTLEAAFSGLSLAIALGLLIGKPFGIVAATVLMVKLKFAKAPRGATAWQMIGIGCLAGIGFTMSLFIGGLSFEGTAPHYAVLTKVGVFGGSLLSALLGYLILRQASRKRGYIAVEE